MFKMEEWLLAIYNVDSTLLRRKELLAEMTNVENFKKIMTRDSLQNFLKNHCFGQTLMTG